MPVSDIPIVLINLALLAIIAIPFVLAFGLVYAAHHIVRPLWAIRYLEAQRHSEQPHATPARAVPETSQSTHRHGVALSAFGR
jgi:hypothetical protein